MFGQSGDLAARSQLAKQAMTEGRFEDAIILYRELVRALPGNPGLAMNLGLALHSAGRYRKAIEQFQAVLKRQPNSAPAWLMLGLARQKLGESEKAVVPLQRALKAEPGNKTVLLELADAFLSLGRLDEAATKFQQLAALDPGHAKAWQGLGLSYVSLSNRCFAELEKIAPESAYWYALLARSRASRGQYRSAFYLCKQALAKDSNLRGVHAALAEIYRKTGHQEWAEVEEEKERQLSAPDCVSEQLQCDFAAERYQKIVEGAKLRKTPESYYWQSRAYSELALNAFGHLDALPPSAALHELKAQAYRVQDLHVDSVREWQEALKLAPEDLRLKRELARSLWLDGDYQTARPLLEELLKQSESAELHHQLGDTLLGLQMPDKAIPFLEKAVRSSPGLLPAHASLARAYLRVGNLQQAITHTKIALRIDEDGSLHYQLARAYQRTGQQDLAKKIMQESKRISESIQVRRRKQAEEYQITPP